MKIRLMRKVLAVTLSSILVMNIAGYADSTVLSTANTTETTQQQINMYQWDKLAEMAIKENVDFKTAEVDKMKLGRQADDLLNTVNTIQSAYLTFTDKKDKSDPLVDNLTLLKNSQSSISDNVTLKQEVLRDTIKGLFVTINRYETQLSSLDQQVVLNNRLIQVDRKKLQLGLIGKYDLEKNFNGYQKVERTRNSLKMNIDKLYTSLKQLAGIEKNSPIKLDYGFIAQEPIIALDYDSGLVKMKSSNMKIAVYLKNAQRANDFQVGVKGRYPAGDATFAQAEFDGEKAQMTLDNAIRELPYKYDAAYNALMDAYDNYNLKQNEYEVKKLDAKNTALKLKLGSASKLEQIAMDTQMKAMDNDLLAAQLDYVSAKFALESTIKGTN